MQRLQLQIICTLISVVSFSIAENVSAADGQPNLLFIFADDQAFDTIHALGNEEIETPNLDRLVERGTTFTHAYNQGGWHGAVCVASRTMLVTGRFLWHARNDEKNLKEQYVANKLTWPQLLEQAGYDTYFSGKWHVKADASQVFKTARHVRGGMPSQTPQGYNRPLSEEDDAWKPWDLSFGGFWQGGKHWSEVLGDDAVDYLGASAKTSNPFFMYLAFNAPHDPRQSPKEYVDKYPLDKISLPQPFLAEYPFEIGSNRIRDEKLAPFPRTEYSVKVNRQEYYAIITHLDAQIGRILKALDGTGKTSETYIVFTADHGLSCGHHGLLGKQNMYDHSVRVPFMIVGPGIARGHTISTPIYLQDVMPTMLQLAGAETPEHVNYQSLLPILTGEREQSYDSIYTAYTETQRAITSGNDKLIAYPKINKTLLFDLEKDPLETNDLSEMPEHAEKVEFLLKKLKEWQRRTGDPLALHLSNSSSSK